MRRVRRDWIDRVDPRWFALVISGAIVATQLPVLSTIAGLPAWAGYGALDYELYMDATRRWLAGGPFYEPYQLAGPYPIRTGDILYPPVGLWLFVPFTFLPVAVWWAIPIAVTAWAIARMRPHPLTWPFMVLCLVWPPTMIKLVAGNPLLWVVAVIALGMQYRWPIVFALVKPSLFPIVVYGVNRRSWWIALAAFGLLSLPFGWMWRDWLNALLNSRGGGLLYSGAEVPTVLLPIIARVGQYVRERSRWTTGDRLAN